MSLKKQALSSIFWTTLQQFSNQGIAFIVSLILARLLMPAEFGLIAMISVFMAVGRTLIDSGLNQSLIRSSNITQEDLDTVFLFNLIGSVFIYLIVYFTAPLISNFYKQPLLTNIIRVLCLTFIINAFYTIPNTQLTKNLDFKTQMRVTTPSLIIGGIVGIILAYLGFGVWSLVFSTLTQSLAAAIQLWFWSEWKPSWHFNKRIFKTHFKYGYKLTFSALLDTLFNNVYPIVIGKFFAPAQVGFFNRADTLKQLPVTNIGSILNKVTFPLFSKIKDENERLKILYKKLMQLVIFIVAPTILFMSALAEPLFRLLFTEKWLPAVPYFQILCWNGILYPIHSYNLNILKVKGRSDLFLKLEIIKKSMVALLVIVSFQFGIYGLLYGSVIISILGFFINTYYSGKFINYSSWQQIKDIFPILALAAISSFLVLKFDFFMKNIFKYDFLRIFVSSIWGLIIYLSIAFAFRVQSLFELIKIFNYRSFKNNK